MASIEVDIKGIIKQVNECVMEYGLRMNARKSIVLCLNVAKLTHMVLTVFILCKLELMIQYVNRFFSPRVMDECLSPIDGDKSPALVSVMGKMQAVKHTTLRGHSI